MTQRITGTITARLMQSLVLLMSLWVTPGFAEKCLYVSSYHKGYEWNDGIEKGIEAGLNDQCTLSRFYLDTKRNTEEQHGKEKALEALEYIRKIQPDIVIAGDDNASKYLVLPYLKNTPLPVVFCGINWNVDAYGYPYDNATGMVEVVPIEPLLEVIVSAVGQHPRGIYLSSDVYTEHKDYARYREIYQKHDIEIEAIFVSSLDDWKQAYLRAQSADFVILGNNGGINDWDIEQASQFATTHAKAFTVTNYDWMMPYSMFAMTKIPEEQGQWAAEVALSILGGEHPSNIPIIANRRWRLYSNPELLKKTGNSLPQHILYGSIKVTSTQ